MRVTSNRFDFGYLSDVLEIHILPRRNVMTRIARFFLASAALALIAFSANSASAGNTPKGTATKVLVKQPTSNTHRLNPQPLPPG